MRRSRRTVLLVGVVAGAALAIGGCGGTESTVAPATTESTTPATTASTTDTATTTVAAPTRPGRASTGKTLFATKCSGCHAAGGTRAAFGPKLAGKGLTRALIRTTVKNGRGQMPAGRAQGQDFEDVVAYVLSLQ